MTLQGCHFWKGQLFVTADDGTFTRAPDSLALAYNTRHWALTPGSWGLSSTLDDYMRLMTDDEMGDRQWTVALNGTALQPTAYVKKPLDFPYEDGFSEPGHYATFACPRQLAQNGVNQIAITLAEGRPAKLDYLDVILP